MANLRDPQFLQQLSGQKAPQRKPSEVVIANTIDSRNDNNKNITSGNKAHLEASNSRLDRSNSSSQIQNDRNNLSSSHETLGRLESVSNKLKVARPSVSFLTFNKTRDSSVPPMRGNSDEANLQAKIGLSQFGRKAEHSSNKSVESPVVIKRRLEADGGVLTQSEPQTKASKSLLVKISSLSDHKENIVKLASATSIKWNVSNRRTSKELDKDKHRPRSKSSLYLPPGRTADREDSFEEHGKVQELDHWDNERKQQKQATTAKRSWVAQPDKKQTLGEDVQDFTSPKINQKVLNFIMSEDTDDGKIGDSDMEAQSGWKTRPTAYQIQQDTNKQILNTILMNKLDKNMNKKPGESRNNSAQLNTDTLTNFKNLKNNLGAIVISKLIDYDGLYQKIIDKRDAPKTMHDFTQFIRSKEEEEKRKCFTTKENLLLGKYQAFAAEIDQKKELLAKLMLDTYHLNVELKACGTEIEEARSELLAIEMRFNDYKYDNAVTPKSKISRKKAVQKNFFNLIDDYKSLDKRKTELTQTTNELKEKTESLEKKLTSSHQTIRVVETQIKDLRLSKSEMRFELKGIYLSMLKNESYLSERENSLIYIIKQLWNIREEVIEDYFPKYLNREALRYLFEQATIQYQLDQAAKYKESEEYKQIVGKYTASGSESVSENQAKPRPNFLHMPMSKITAIIQSRLNKLKHNLVNKKKPIFQKQMMEVGLRTNILGWEDMSDIKTSDNSNHQDIDSFQLQQAMEKFEKNLKQESQKRTKEEIVRLYEHYINKEANPKMLEEFCKLLLSLFGKSLGERVYFDFVRAKQIHEQRAQINHTYKLESRKPHINPLNGPNPISMMMAYGSSFRKVGHQSQNQSEGQMKESKTRAEVEMDTQEQFFQQYASRPASRNTYSAQKTAFSEIPQDQIQEDLSTVNILTHSGKSSYSKTSSDFFRSRRNIRSASVLNKKIQVIERPENTTLQTSVEKPKTLVKSQSMVKVGQITREMIRIEQGKLR